MHIVASATFNEMICKKLTLADRISGYTQIMLSQYNFRKQA